MLYPKVHFDSIYDITGEYLHGLGIKAIILDIDNTLVPYHTPKPTGEVTDWIDSMKASGISVTVASNNNMERISEFCKGLEVFFTFNSAKPFPKCVTLTRKHYGVDRKEIAIIGDQLFTDILCGRLSGAFPILVTPINSPESRFIRFKRKLEKPILKAYRKKHPEEFGKEDLN